MTDPDPQPRLWMRLSRYVLDARGREVRCLTFNEVQRRAGSARRRIDIRAFRKRSSERHNLGAGVLVVFWIWFFVGMIAHSTGAEWLRVTWLIATVVFVAACILKAGLPQRTTPRLLRALLAARICPHCAYDLAGQSEHDNAELITCPECACVWRITNTD
jgi:hypothetical protein